MKSGDQAAALARAQSIDITAHNRRERAKHDVDAAKPPSSPALREPGST